MSAWEREERGCHAAPPLAPRPLRERRATFAGSRYARLVGVCRARPPRAGTSASWGTRRRTSSHPDSQGSACRRRPRTGHIHWLGRLLTPSPRPDSRVLYEARRRLRFRRLLRHGPRFALLRALKARRAASAYLFTQGRSAGRRTRRQKSTFPCPKGRLRALYSLARRRLVSSYDSASRIGRPSGSKISKL